MIEPALIRAATPWRGEYVYTTTIINAFYSANFDPRALKKDLQLL